MSDIEDYYNGDWGDYDLENDVFYEEYVEKEIAQALNKYVAPILLALGTIGNIISIIIMTKLSRKVISTCLYLAVLAAMDLVVLYTRCGNDWLRNIAEIDISYMLMVYTDSICKVYPFVFSFIFHMTKWLIVAMAVEGSISVKYPRKALTMCTLERARAVILLLTVLLVCVNSHYFWTFERVTLKEFTYHDSMLCTFAKHGFHSDEFQAVVWPTIDLLVSDILPSAVCIASVIIMAVRMYKGLHRGDEEFQAWQKRYTLDPSSVNRFKVTFMIVCICFLILTLPKFGYVIFTYVVYRHQLIEYSAEFDAQQTLAHAICSTLEHCFLSSKFFIYLASSPRFRTECTNLFRCLRKRQNDVHALHSSQVPSSSGFGQLHTERSPNNRTSRPKLRREHNGIYQNVPDSAYTVDSFLSSTV